MICDSITDKSDVLQRSIDPLASLAAELEDTAAVCFPQIDMASPDKLLMGDFKLGRSRGDTLMFMASPFISWRAVQICVNCPCVHCVNKRRDAPPCQG
jgi:hypothetical protein